MITTIKKYEIIINSPAGDRLGRLFNDNDNVIICVKKTNKEKRKNTIIC